MAGGLSDLQREYLRARDAYRASGQAMQSTPSGSPAFQGVRDAHDRAWRRYYSLSERLPGQAKLAARQATGAAAFMDAGLGPEYDPIPSRRSGRAAYRAAQEDFKAAREAWLRAPSRGDHTPEAKAMHRAGERAQRAFDARKILGEEGFMRGVAPSARSTAARGLSTALGVAASPIIDYALDPESRTPVQFARSQEEAITGMVPGLVSPSELPPPAALPPDRLKAVEATQGMVGVAQDFESGVVTEQEVRAYVANKFAKGEKLPEWADKITSVKNGRLVVKPVNPRAKARQKAAKRPHNPRMGTKRRHGTY